MPRTFQFSTAILALLYLFAGPIAVEAQSAPKALEQARENWRVMIATTQHLDFYTAAGGLDSFSVEGGFDNCRRIALTIGETLVLEKKSTVKLFCLNTKTGDVKPIKR